MKENLNIIRDEFLNFYDEDTYYLVKIFVRKKDSIVLGEDNIFNSIFGSHNERLFTTFTVESKEEFEKICKISEFLVNNIPYSRAYFNINPMSKKKTLLQMDKDISSMIHDKLNNDKNSNYLKRLSKLSYSVTSRKESNKERKYNYIILDIDLFDDRFIKNKNKNIRKTNEFISFLKSKNIDFIKINTINGFHIVFSHKYSSILKFKNSYENKIYDKFINEEFVDEKTNSAVLMYYNKELDENNS